MTRGSRSSRFNYRLTFLDSRLNQRLSLVFGIQKPYQEKIK